MSVINGFDGLREVHIACCSAIQNLTRACVAMLLGLASLLAGCEGTLGRPHQIETAPLETSAASLEVETLVFGRIRWIQNSQERSTYTSALGWSIAPKYLRVDDMQSGFLDVEKDGTFTWNLPRATYILQQIHWRDAWDGPHRLTPHVAFQVTGEAHAYCLGTLIIDLKAKRDIIGGLWIKGWKIRIEDDCEHMASLFRSRYSDPDLILAKSLMIYDPRIPDRPMQLERQDQALEFMRSILPGLMTVY